MHTTSPRILIPLLGVFVLLGGACSSNDQPVVAQEDHTTTTADVADGDAMDEGHNDEAVDARSVEDDGTATASGSEGLAGDGTPADDHGDTVATGGESDGHTAEATDGDVDLVIPIEMNDFGYELATTSIPVGSMVRFEFVNVGFIEHEAMFGSAHQQEEFAADDDHGEGDHHGAVRAITLDPGEAGSLVVEFGEAGEILIGCHLPGHWDAGMVTTLEIV